MIASVKKPRLPFAISALHLTSGSALAQLIALSAGPFLTRLYPTEAFGVAGLFASLAGVIGAVSCLRYDQAILLPEDDGDAARLCIGASGLALVAALICAMALWILREVQGALAIHYWMLPPFVWLLSMQTILSQWNVRAQRFRRLAATRFTGSSGTTAGKIIFGCLGWATGGLLVASSLIGQLATTLLIFGKGWRDDRGPWGRALRSRRIFATLGEYRRYPQFAAGSALLIEGSLRLPILVIAYFFDEHWLGLFAFTFMLLKMPLAVVGGSIAQVFYQKASTAGPGESLAALTAKVFHGLASIMLLPCIILALYAGHLFGFVFGEGWEAAGVFAQILAASILIEFLCAPLSSLFDVLGEQPRALRFDLGLLLLRAAALAAGGWTGDIFLTVALFTGADVVGRALKFRFILTTAGLTTTGLLKMLLDVLRTSLPWVAALTVLLVIGAHPIVLLVAAVLATAGYLGLFLRRTELWSLLRKAGAP